jgi:ThiF family
MGKTHRVTRFSDLDWASELIDIAVIGAGGINSYNIFNLSRIGHSLYVWDFDSVDSTNTIGGQLYRTKDISKPKVEAIIEICREFGSVNEITPISDRYKEESGMLDICIMGVDNMSSRKEIFQAWCNHVQKSEDKSKCLLLDGRLNAELFEVVVIQGDREEEKQKYREDYLFGDEEVEELSCTAKQTSFMAMGISCFMVGILCNWLTNKKLGENFREISFFNRFYLPLLDYKQINIEQHAEKEAAETVV